MPVALRVNQQECLSFSPFVYVAYTIFVGFPLCSPLFTTTPFFFLPCLLTLDSLFFFVLLLRNDIHYCVNLRYPA